MQNTDSPAGAILPKEVPRKLDCPSGVPDPVWLGNDSPFRVYDTCGGR